MLLTRSDVEVILGEALAGGGDLAEIFVERRRTNTISLEGERIEKVNSGLDQGAGIRLLAGESSIYVFTNDLSLAGLKTAAQTAAAALAEGKAGRRLIRLGSADDAPPPPVRKGDMRDKVAIVAAAEKEARAAGDAIRQVMVSYGDNEQEILVANTNGRVATDRRYRTTLVINVVAGDGSNVQTGYESLGGTQGLELLSVDKVRELGARAARRALLLLRARPAPAGRMAVVMAGEAGGTMIHEACGHGLEADIVGKEMSVYAGKLGQRVASELVTVIDDPTLPGKYGSYSCDDEGTPAQKTVLIENGILKTYMYDLEWARRQGKSSTGNGRRQSFHFPPIPRMSNTYLAPGDVHPEEIIARTERGLLVKRMGGGQVNPTTGDFVFEVAEGYLIERGKITVPVRGATLSGNGPQALMAVDLVGNDLGFAIGTCGKDGQGVPVSDAQPTIRIPELVVGGLL
ncbi:MAG: TldD protein [Bacillota bacterium]|nr:TldD protein [Bacillota bacterium]MDK2926135.1 TldD protein [Bacillota bacterium]MDK2960482.1 TldD protein [Bacillota bacterium]